MFFSLPSWLIVASEVLYAWLFPVIQVQVGTPHKLVRSLCAGLSRLPIELRLLAERLGLIDKRPIVSLPGGSAGPSIGR